MRRLALTCVLALLATSGCARELPSAAPATTHSPIATDSASIAPPEQVSPSLEATEVATEPETSATPTPTQVPAVYKEGDSGDEIRDLQHRLLQLQWYEGEITGTYDEKTKLAVEGFQGKRNLPVLGYVDQGTLDSLHSMTRQPTDDEKNNVIKPGPAIYASGSSGDEIKDLQARLKQVGWYDAKIDGSYGEVTVTGVRGFQKKRNLPVTGEVDQRTLDRLHSMTRKPTEDEKNNVVPSKKAAPKGMTLDDRCLTGRVLCVSKAQRKLAWVIDGQVHMVLDVRFGSSKTPTRNGVFSVGWKSRNHVSKEYGSEMPYAMFFSGGQAVHYSSDFAARGYQGASHGCVNVRDKAAIASLFDQVKVGDTVVVYAG